MVIDQNLHQLIVTPKHLNIGFIPTYLSNFYVWIPLYCFIVLLIIKYNRLELTRIFASLFMVETMSGLVVVIINQISQHFLSGHITLALSGAFFCSIYLGKRLISLKLCLFIWSGMIIDNHLKGGFISAQTMISSILLSAVLALVCNRYLKFER